MENKISEFLKWRAYIVRQARRCCRPDHSEVKSPMKVNKVLIDDVLDAKLNKQ
jgi:hypothetical protein